MAVIYPQHKHSNFVAVTSWLNLAWYIYQAKEQNLKNHVSVLSSGIVFYFHILHKLHLQCILQLPVFLYDDSMFFFLSLLFASGLIDKIVTCDVFAVLQDYKWLLPCTPSALPMSFIYWEGCFLDIEQWQIIYIKCFLCIFSFALFFSTTSQIMS